MPGRASCSRTCIALRCACSVARSSTRTRCGPSAGTTPSPRLRLKAFDPELGKPLWDKLDVSFFLRHDARDIAWLTRHLFNKVDSDAAVVKARISPAGEGLQVAVYVKDQPDLFARICS